MIKPALPIPIIIVLFISPDGGMVGTRVGGITGGLVGATVGNDCGGVVGATEVMGVVG